MPKLSRTKMIATAILVVLALLILLQNLKPVEVTISRFGSIAVKMPMAVLLLLMLGAGFAIGLVVASRMAAKKRK